MFTFFPNIQVNGVLFYDHVSEGFESACGRYGIFPHDFNEFYDASNESLYTGSWDLYYKALPSDSYGTKVDGKIIATEKTMYDLIKRHKDKIKFLKKYASIYVGDTMELKEFFKMYPIMKYGENNLDMHIKEQPIKKRKKKKKLFLTYLRDTGRNIDVGMLD